GCDRARREAVLDQHHDDGVEDRRLLRGRQAAGELEEREIAEVDVAEQVDEVSAAHDDVRGVGPGDVGAELLPGHVLRTRRVLYPASPKSASATSCTRLRNVSAARTSFSISSASAV